MTFTLFNKKKTVGYKRVSGIFGVSYDYSNDNKNWLILKYPNSVAIKHTHSVELKA